MPCTHMHKQEINGGHLGTDRESVRVTERKRGQVRVCQGSTAIIELYCTCRTLTVQRKNTKNLTKYLASKGMIVRNSRPASLRALLRCY